MCGWWNGDLDYGCLDETLKMRGDIGCFLGGFNVDVLPCNDAFCLSIRIIIILVLLLKASICILEIFFYRPNPNHPFFLGCSSCPEPAGPGAAGLDVLPG